MMVAALLLPGVGAGIVKDPWLLFALSLLLLFCSRLVSLGGGVLLGVLGLGLGSSVFLSSTWHYEICLV